MSTEVIHTIETLMPDGFNVEGELVVKITLDEDYEGAAVSIDGKLVRGKDLIDLSRLIERVT